MPITMEPREGGRIIYFRFTEPLLVVDFAHIIEKEQALRDRASIKIHTVAECSKIRSVPLGTLRIVRRVPSLVHPTKGNVAVVGANEIIQPAALFVTRRLGLENVAFFSTEEDGMAHLRQIIAGE